MKKILALCLAGALVLGLAACSSKTAAEGDQQQTSSAVSTASETSSASSAEQKAPASSTAATTPKPSSSTSSKEEAPKPSPTPTAAPTPEPTPTAAPTPEPTPTPAPQSSVSLSSVRSAMLSSVAVTDPLMIETDALSGLYGIDPGWVVQSASFTTMSGTLPDEIVMVEATDVSAAQNVAACLNSRLSEVLNQASNYDAESYAAIQQCYVGVNGNFVCLFLSGSYAQFASVYYSYVS